MKHTIDNICSLFAITIFKDYMKYTNGQVFKIVAPAGYPNGDKVAAIKALRCITNVGLKEAKDMSEAPNEQTITVNVANEADPERLSRYVSSCIDVLERAGFNMSGTSRILKDLRKLATEAIAMHEDELANEILQLVMTEKLRRGI